MARVNLNQSPYYDDYNKSKQYYQLLAIPGRVAQSREFTTMQTYLRNIIKSIGDSILKNGDIVEGCQVISSGYSVTVTSGKVYMDGIVMDIPEDITVPITRSGTENVGVKLMEVVVDENTDNTLRDPAQGYDNYNQPGCNRLKRYLSVVINDPEAATIATLVEGDIMVESYSPEYDTLSQTLARRTYDESGSYIVEGLKVRTENLNSTQYNIVIEPGKAYILGYELKIPTARRIAVDRSQTYSSVLANNYIFETGTSEYLLDSDPHVKAITKVTGITSATESKTIASNVDTVLLDNYNIITITEVKQGNTTYSISTRTTPGDCSLVRDGNRYYLKWEGTENYPAPGTTYTVTYTYTKDFEDTTDYSLSLSGGSHYIEWTVSGEKPLDNTQFSVTYDQYLARKDIVYIDKYGVIDVLKGVPAEYGFEVFPESPLNTLVLADVSNPPNGSVTSIDTKITVENIGLTRFTMNDIQNILNRVRTMEYDQAILSLNDDARQVSTTNDKKGIFTDPLIDLSRIDYYYNLTSSGVKIDASKPIYDMAIDLAKRQCYLPVVSSNTNLTYTSTGSTCHKYNRLVSLATTGERVALAQSHATKSFLVNPYGAFPQVPEIEIDPAVDSWIEDTIIEVPVSLNDSKVVAVSTRTLDDLTWLTRNNRNWSTKSITFNVDTESGRTSETTSSDTILSEKAVTYIRQRTITVTGKNFVENLDNIQCFFDGVLVPLTATGNTESGTLSGTVKADASGSFTATFEIPSGIYTGVREVLLKSTYEVSGQQNSAFTLYTAAGTARDIQRTVTTITTVLLHRMTTILLLPVYVDPVGQTFTLPRLSLIKGIDIYFEAKSNTSPIVCEIREVSEGNITSTIYAHKYLLPNQVTVDAEARVATRFDFDDPVLLEENKEYAFILRSPSDAYRIWVSEMGGTDVITGDVVLRNSYLQGVMMSSSNNSSWTTHQTSDIKFQLIEDVYANNSVVNFGDISVTDAARLYLTADAAIPNNTSVDWLYSTNGAAGVENYKSITPYNLVSLLETVSTIKLKANLTKTADNHLSPLIALDTLSLTASHYDVSGCYISNNVSGLDSYTDVKVVVDTYKPAGTNFVFKVSNDAGANLTTMTEEGSGRTLGNGWVERTYDATLSSSNQCKLFIEATSDTKYQTPRFRRLRVIMS